MNDSTSVALNEELILQQHEERETIRSACESNYVSGVAMLLNLKLKKNVDAFKDIIDDQTTGRTLLIIAAENGHADMLSVILLMLRKLSSIEDQLFWVSTYLERQDTYGLTALHWCSLKGYVDCLSVILFLEPSLLTCINRSGQTSLALAVTHQKRETIEYLESLSTNSLLSRHVIISKNNFSLAIKSILSKQTLIRLYQELPSYAYLTSLVLAISISFYIIVQSCPREGIFPSNCYFRFHLISIVLQVIIWILSWSCRNTNPGSLSIQQNNNESSDKLLHSSDSNSDIKSVLSVKPASGRTYLDALQRTLETSINNKFISSRSYCCHRCRCYRPLRSGHSRLHGRCIPKYDHFCNFLWSDIGRNNYIYFYLFLWCMSLCLPIFLFLCADYLVYQVDGDFYMKEFSHDTITEAFTITIKGFTVWSFLVWVMCVLLLAIHSRMSILGMTSREYLQSKKYSYLEKEHLYSHCTTSRLGMFPGYLVNCLDKFFPLPHDECYDENELVELMDRATDRFRDWQKSTNISTILHRIGIIGGGKPSTEERYNV